MGLSSSFFEVASALVATLALYLLAKAAYRVYYHPLHSFPGPRMASISRLYEFYFDVIQGGMYMQKIEKLHQEYGGQIHRGAHVFNFQGY